MLRLHAPLVIQDGLTDAQVLGRDLQQLVEQMAHRVSGLPEQQARGALILELCSLSAALRRIASGLCTGEEQ